MRPRAAAVAWALPQDSSKCKRNEYFEKQPSMAGWPKSLGRRPILLKLHQNEEGGEWSSKTMPRAPREAWKQGKNGNFAGAPPRTPLPPPPLLPSTPLPFCSISPSHTTARPLPWGAARRPSHGRHRTLAARLPPCAFALMPLPHHGAPRRTPKKLISFAFTRILCKGPEAGGAVLGCMLQNAPL